MTPFHNEECSKHAMLCHIGALWYYMEQTAIQSLDLLFICHGEGKTQGASVSKQRLVHLVVDFITLAYRQARHWAPIMTCHSMKWVSSSCTLCSMWLQSVLLALGCYHVHVFSIPVGWMQQLSLNTFTVSHKVELVPHDIVTLVIKMIVTTPAS